MFAERPTTHLCPATDARDSQGVIINICILGFFLRVLHNYYNP